MWSEWMISKKGVIFLLIVVSGVLLYTRIQQQGLWFLSFSMWDTSVSTSTGYGNQLESLHDSSEFFILMFVTSTRWGATTVTLPWYSPTSSVYRQLKKERNDNNLHHPRVMVGTSCSGRYHVINSLLCPFRSLFPTHLVSLSNKIWLIPRSLICWEEWEGVLRFLTEDSKNIL